MPVVVGLLIMVMPRLMRAQGSQIRGEVAVIDPTGQIFDGLRAALTQEAITKRRTDVARRALEVECELRRVLPSPTKDGLQRAKHFTGPETKLR